MSAEKRDLVHVIKEFHQEDQEFVWILPTTHQANLINTLDLLLKALTTAGHGTQFDVQAAYDTIMAKLIRSLDKGHMIVCVPDFNRNIYN